MIRPRSFRPGPTVVRAAGRILAAATIVAGALVPSCTCARTTIATVDEPVKGRIIERTIVRPDLDVGAGPHIGVVVPTGRTSERCTLELDTDPAVTWPATCAEGTAFVASPDGRHLAWGVAGGPWSFAHVTKSGRAYPDPRRLDDPIDWSTAPPFDAARAAALLPAYQRAAPDLAMALLEDVRARDGQGGVAELLVATVDGPFLSGTAFGCEGARREPWTEAMASLSGAEKARVEGALRQAIEAPRPKGAVLARALAFLDLEDPGLRPVLVARLEELAGAPHDVPLASEMLLRVVSRTSSERAAAVACAMLPKIPYLSVDPGRFRRLERVALAAVAKAGLPCEAVSAEVYGCHPAAFCASAPASVGEGNDRLCQIADYRPMIAGILDGTLQDARRATCVTPPADGSVDAAALAAWRELPPDIAFRRSRGTYALEQGDAPCSPANVGQPCRCEAATKNELLSWVCKRPATERILWREGCRLLVDDAGRRIRVVAGLADLQADAAAADEAAAAAHSAAPGVRAPSTGADAAR